MSMELGSKKKILIVGSSGGHLLQVLRVSEILEDFELVWVCFDKPDARYFLSKYKTYWCYFPVTRNLWNFIKNTLQAIKVLYKERPSFVLSSGAAVAIPYFCLSKLFGIKTVYIESFTRVVDGSMTGRFVYPITDLFLYQWESLAKVYPRGVCIGRLP